MPDFSKYVKADNDEIYCWDKNRCRFVKLTYNDVPTEKVPPEVIETFMLKLGTEETNA